MPREPHHKSKQGTEPHRRGRVVGTMGRAVVVRDGEGERVCVLSGQRAVIGDEVEWVPARDAGGKLMGVGRRTTMLSRRDGKGREEVLAANLRGLLVVAAAQYPPFRAGLVDRYWVAAGVGGLDAAVVITKTDLGVPDSVRAEVAEREAQGVPFLWVSSVTGEGVTALRDFVAEQGGAWALVGHSGVGKTSLVARILPGADVGPIEDLSQFWERGQHATSASTWFDLTPEAAIVDSPGIRTFSPGEVTAEEVRRYFPGFLELRCKYRSCLHRPGEEGCVADASLPEGLVTSYRRLLADVVQTAPKY